ncbi:MAG: serine hydrolase [Chloroflexia bacterium]|nr:serine hydrolase [Chloroflexia bacterium]
MKRPPRALRSSLARARSWPILVLTLLSCITAPVSAQAAAMSWPALDQSLAALAPQSNLLVAEFQGGACATIHGRNEATPLAIASTFKLYVLGELARQIQAGEVDWDDGIVLADSLRSMPSGDYAWVAAGTVVDVQSLAEAMIRQSDNTATDHLIDFLGRENVQRAFAAYGHSAPETNIPLLLTRELFGIKMSQSQGWMDRYMSSTDDEQARLLEEEIDPLTINPAAGWGNWNGPTAIEGIEWFASAADLCRVTASLWSMGAQADLEPVREILTSNRGGVPDTAAWPRAGYKGGFEAGVLNMTYILERSDGRVFFVSAGYNQPRGAIDQSAANAELDGVFACLGVVFGPGSCADPE